jgi:hypothetical protein
MLSMVPPESWQVARRPCRCRVRTGTARGRGIIGADRDETHRGEWRGHPATGRPFEAIDEIYIFEIEDGHLHGAVAVEDNLPRMRQLGFEL